MTRSGTQLSFGVIITSAQNATHRQGTHGGTVQLGKQQQEQRLVDTTLMGKAVGRQQLLDTNPPQDHEHDGIHHQAAVYDAASRLSAVAAAWCT